jgi:aspartyl-tRNA(Asn)/glutamyl-tRNA(Gln) amidotransferase subunit A
VDAEVVAAVRQCGQVFADLGAQVQSIAFEEAAEAVALNPRGLVIAAEAYTVHQERLAAHVEAYDPIVAQRLMQGKHISAHEYLNTTRAWEKLRHKVQHTLRDIDALLVPSTPIAAQPVAQVDASMESYTQYNLRYLRNTATGNILNLCGLSLPCGFTRQGLPIGLMIYAKPFHEDRLLRIGYAFEQASAWHTRTPDLSWAGESLAKQG